MGNKTLSSLQTSSVDIPDGNGITYFGINMPQELLCHIFSFVPGKDLVQSVTRVCKFWNELLMDHHFWYTKLQVEGIVLPESTRLRLMNMEDQSQALLILKILGSNQLQFHKNLIKNPSGAEGLTHWEVRHGGDGLIIEENPAGSDPIPEEANLPTQHCFVTSYGTCFRKQVINLEKMGFTSFIMNTLKPKIEISEWLSARWDCRSEAKLSIEFKGSNSRKTEELSWSSDDEGVVQRQWYKVMETIEEYPENLSTITYVNFGKDRQFWAGHYGSKSAGSSVILVL